MIVVVIKLVGNAISAIPASITIDAERMFGLGEGLHRYIKSGIFAELRITAEMQLRFGE